MGARQVAAAVDHVVVADAARAHAQQHLAGPGRGTGTRLHGAGCWHAPNCSKNDGFHGGASFLGVRQAAPTSSVAEVVGIEGADGRRAWRASGRERDGQRLAAPANAKPVRSRGCQRRRPRRARRRLEPRARRPPSSNTPRSEMSRTVRRGSPRWCATCTRGTRLRRDWRGTTSTGRFTHRRSEARARDAGELRAGCSRRAGRPSCSCGPSASTSTAPKNTVSTRPRRAWSNRSGMRDLRRRARPGSAGPRDERQQRGQLRIERADAREVRQPRRMRGARDRDREDGERRGDTGGDHGPVVDLATPAAHTTGSAGSRSTRHLACRAPAVEQRRRGTPRRGRPRPRRGSGEHRARRAGTGPRSPVGQRAASGPATTRSTWKPGTVTRGSARTRASAVAITRRAAPTTSRSVVGSSM